MIFTLILLTLQTAYSQEQWYSLNDAFTEAVKQNKKVLLYFSVPESCDGCRALEKNIFSSDEFSAFAKDKYVLAKVNFDNASSAAEKAENLLIVEKYNKDGFFPLVLVLSRDGRVLGKSGVYNNETPKAYVRLLESF